MSHGSHYGGQISSSHENPGAVVMPGAVQDQVFGEDQLSCALVERVDLSSQCGHSSTALMGARNRCRPSILVQKYLRPAAIKAGVIAPDWKGRFGFHNFRHSLATAMVKLRVDPKTVQGILRHEDFGTTMDLDAQSDMESMLDAQGKFLSNN